MPQIPEFPIDRSPFAAGGSVSPGIFAEPGQALQQAGAGVSTEMGQLATRVAEAKRGVLADDLSFQAMNRMQAASVKWRQVPDMQAAMDGFNADVRDIRQETLQGLDDPMLQKYVDDRVTEHAITLGRQTWLPALELQQANWRGDLEQKLQDRATLAGNTPAGPGRDAIVKDAHASINGARAGGWLPGDRAFVLGKQFDERLGTSLVSNGLQRDPAGTLKAYAAGAYDNLLGFETKARLQPMVDEATALVTANRWRPAAGAAGGDLADRIIANESGGDAGAKNPLSSAAGAGQFIDSTWLGLVKQNAPDIAAGKSDAEMLALRSDKALSNQMVNAYAAVNGAALAAQGLPTDPGSLYLAHFLGAGGAATVLKADPAMPLSSLLSQQVLSANPNLAGMTAGDLRGTMARKMGGGSDASLAGAVGPPDAGAAISGIQSQVGSGDLTQHQADLAIGIVTRRVQEFNQINAAARSQLEAKINDGVAALQDGHDWAAPVADIRRLLPSDKADAALRTIDEARDAGQAKNAVWFASPQELVAIEARQAGKLTDPSATDFARNQHYAQVLGSQIDARNKSLAADPAGFVAAAKTVQEARAAIDPQNPAPGTQAQIAASLAEQQRLGVAEGDRHALSNDEGAAAVKQIVGAGDPGTVDMAQRLSQTQQLYGQYWPQVFGDLVRSKLPAEYQVLANMDAPAQTVAAGDMQRMLSEASAKGGIEKLKQAASPDAVKQIDQGLDAQLAEFRGTMRSNDTYAIYRDAVAHLAYYNAFRGQDASTALTNAYNGVIGSRYDFAGALRVPKGMLSQVQDTASSIQQALKPEDLAPVRGNPNLTPEQRQGIYLDAIRRGFWATDRGDDGAVLMLRYADNGVAPAKRADGSPVAFKWTELAKPAATPSPSAADLARVGSGQ